MASLENIMDDSHLRFHLLEKLSKRQQDLFDQIATLYYEHRQERFGSVFYRFGSYAGIANTVVLGLISAYYSIGNNFAAQLNEIGIGTPEPDLRIVVGAAVLAAVSYFNQHRLSIEADSRQAEAVQSRSQLDDMMSNARYHQIARRMEEIGA